MIVNILDDGNRPGFSVAYFEQGRQVLQLLCAYHASLLQSPVSLLCGNIVVVAMLFLPCSTANLNMRCKTGPLA
jgi:hypothetical protein